MSVDCTIGWENFKTIWLNISQIEKIDCQFFGTGCTKSSVWERGGGVKVRSEKEADLMMDDNPAQSRRRSDFIPIISLIHLAKLQ